MGFEYRPGESTTVDKPGGIRENRMITPGVYVQTDDDGNVVQSGFAAYQAAVAAGELGSSRLLSSDPKYAGKTREQIADEYGEYYDVVGWADEAGYIGPPVPTVHTPEQVIAGGTVTNDAGFVPGAIPEREKDEFSTPDDLPGDDDETASSIIRDALKDYGLEGLVDDTNLRLIDRWVETGDMTAVWAAVRETATYQTRFPGMQALMDAGRAMTEGAYVEMERQYAQTLHAYGMPEKFYDSADDFANLIGGDVSINEFTQRVATAFEAASGTTAEVRSALETYYGITDSDIAAYYLDPERATNIFEERERFGAARLGGIASETGFGTIARQTAERLQAAGVTDTQARRGFQEMSQSTLAEESVGDVGDITRTDLVGDTFGTDPESGRRIEGRRQRRLAAFSQSGGPALTQGGYTGLGTAN